MRILSKQFEKLRTTVSMQLHFTLMNETINSAEFDCDNEDLNSFFKNTSLLFQQRHFGITMACLEVSNRMVVGYYTLCPASIQREVLSEKMLTGPRPNPIPGFRLCRLAVDKCYQRKGIGKRLLVHALKKCVNQSKEIGGSIVIIDAKNQKAKEFYEHFGFKALPDNFLVLVQTIKQIEKNFLEA